MGLDLENSSCGFGRFFTALSQFECAVGEIKDLLSDVHSLFITDFDLATKAGEA